MNSPYIPTIIVKIRENEFFVSVYSVWLYRYREQNCNWLICLIIAA